VSARPRVVVFAYSEVGVRCLSLLLARGARVVGVVTHPDDPGEARWFGSVAELARAAGLPCHVVRSARSPELLETIRGLRPDLVFSCYFRRLLPGALLALPRLGALNLHGSLLPRYRGRAPVNWAVLHGERETGATLHHMVERADAGDIVDQEAVPIGPEDTAGEVSLRVAEAAVRVLDRQLDALERGDAPRRPQDERLATCFGRRRPEDGRIDWRRPATQVVDLVRAVTRPFPGAFSDTGQGRLYVWKARAVPGDGAPGEVLSLDPPVLACGDGAVALLEWNLEGDTPGAFPLAAGAVGG